MRKNENAIKVLVPFFDKYGEDPKVQVIGGVGTTALLDPHSDFYAEDDTISLSSQEMDLSTLREDGTKRDVDVFVSSSDSDEIGKIRSDLESIVGDKLDASVFGIIERKLPRKIGMTALKTFLADRYIDIESQELVKSLYPFSAQIDPDSLKPWRVESNDFSFHIPHPAMSWLNYCSRSIGGVRAKDVDKVGQLTERLEADLPDFYEWIFDGPGKSQFELSKLIHSAGVGMEPLNQILPDSRAVKAIGIDGIIESEYFMLGENSVATQRVALGQFALKANLLRFFESSGTVRALFQKYAERSIASSIVENR